MERPSVSFTLAKTSVGSRRYDLVSETGGAPFDLVPINDPIAEVHSGHQSIMRPLMQTVEIRLEAGDSVFLVQETTDGFAYSADGGGVLTFKGEYVGPKVSKCLETKAGLVLECEM